MQPFSPRTMRRRGLQEGRRIIDRLVSEFWHGAHPTPEMEAAMDLRTRALIAERTAEVKREGAPEAALRQFVGAVGLGFAESADAFRTKAIAHTGPSAPMH